MSNGIAHISFAGGGVFLPARTPYDRQVLIEYVNHYVGAGRQVQILVDDQRWLVHPGHGQFACYCSWCGSALESACYSATDGKAGYCTKCALGGDAERVSVQQELYRRAG